MLGQTLLLGTTQIAISVTVNALIVLAAGSVAGFLAGRPLWMAVQRWLMGTVLAVLARAHGIRHGAPLKRFHGPPPGMPA